jgi:multidrug efflux pump subunit AcrA (membrane-fusion protein)
MWIAAAVLLACLGAAPVEGAPTPDPQVRTVRLSPGEWQVVLDPAAGHLFLGDSTTGRIEMRAAATGDLLRTITLRQGSLQMLLDGNQGRLFVASDDNLGQSGRILAIDTRTGRVIHSEALESFPSP